MRGQFSKKIKFPINFFILTRQENLNFCPKNDPIAIFSSTKNDGVTVILTELKNRKGNYFVAATKVWGEASGRKNNKPVNSIVSLYPKDDVRSLINRINSGGHRP